VGSNPTSRTTDFPSTCLHDINNLLVADALGQSIEKKASLGAIIQGGNTKVTAKDKF